MSFITFWHLIVVFEPKHIHHIIFAYVCTN